MSSRVVVELFAEDVAHERFLRAMVGRLAREHAKELVLHAGSARGGHGKAIAELTLYQRALKRTGGGRIPDVLVVAIDANCKKLSQARREIVDAVEPQFRGICAIACPDPHIERWFFADPVAFRCVVGSASQLGRRKCQRGWYKSLLSRAVRDAGHVPLLGGIEFARELVEAMDLQRAKENEKSLHAFINAMTARLNSL